ncbi:Alpha/Beta hydrolase protein [Aspergillus pseudoustus]|uniref:Carboxypeptidase n=1 Tax=Aspergillus pseudoustus TaxID=1810923 RepID=A0ABR4KF48_9EURO
MSFYPDMSLGLQDILPFSQSQSQSTWFSASTRHQQDQSLCDARTDHYTGSVPISNGKEIFYWMIRSMDNPTEAPVLIWLSGGPGGASTYAALTEVGPCWVNITDNSTYHNPYSWAQHANLLIIDQPAGVGFSKESSDPAHRVTTLDQAAYDFNEFLHTFFTEIFPDLQHNGLHLASESYGGRWGPAFLHHILALQNVRAEQAVTNPIKSLILVNAVIGTLGGLLSTANYEFGCTGHGVATRLGLGYNETVCSALQELGPECEKYAEICERENDLTICKDASQFCEGRIGPLAKLPGVSPYNVEKACSDTENLCLDNLAATEAFFNKREVQHMLGYDNYQYGVINHDITTSFDESGSTTQSVLREVVDLLQHTPVRLLVMNGDLDALVITAGQKRIFDNIPWRGQLEYRQQPWKDWHYTDASGERQHGGQVKGSSKLRFVSFQKAGHMVPGDQPEAALAVLNEWLDEKIILSVVDT